MEENMIFTDEYGNEATCEIVAKFVVNRKNYVAYTDGSIVDNQKELFISSYNMIDGKMKLEEITNEDEWTIVNKKLDEILSEAIDYE